MFDDILDRRHCGWFPWALPNWFTVACILANLTKTMGICCVVGIHAPKNLYFGNMRWSRKSVANPETKKLTQAKRKIPDQISLTRQLLPYICRPTVFANNTIVRGRSNKIARPDLIASDGGDVRRIYTVLLLSNLISTYVDCCQMYFQIYYTMWSRLHTNNYGHGSFEQG